MCFAGSKWETGIRRKKINDKADSGQINSSNRTSQPALTTEDKHSSS